MNVSLTSELESYVNEKVKSGLYSSASEVVRESLRLMHSYDDLQNKKILQLNKSIEEGLEQLKLGTKVTASESYKKLKKKIEHLAKKKHG